MTVATNQTHDVPASDGEWFDKHPGVVTRWRPYVSGEAGPAAEQELRLLAADAEREGLEAQLVVKVTRLSSDSMIWAAGACQTNGKGASLLRLRARRT